MNLLLPMTIAGLLVTGMGVALLGSVMVPLARKLDIDEARVGGMVSMFGFAMIPVIFTVGFLTDLVGRQSVLTAGSLLMAASLILLARSRMYATALVAVLLFSASWSAMINVINVLVPDAFLAPSEHASRMSFATNLANVFFGLGAFLTPLLTAFLIRRRDLTTTLMLIAAVVLLPMLLATGVDFEALEQQAEQGASTTTPVVESEIATLLSDPIMWLCALALFFYGPLEATMAAWTTKYLGEMRVPEQSASSLLSCFWLAFMGSRLITAFLSPWIDSKFSLPAQIESMTILVLSLACIVVLFGVVVCRLRGVAISLVIAAGFVFGPIFPAITATLFRQFDSSLHGRAIGLMFAIGGIGWTCIPILIGIYARRTSIQRGFAVAIGSAVGLLIVALAMVSY